jgi:cytochrome c553
MVVGLLVLLVVAPAALAAESVRTREQIEADWLRQDEVRTPPAGMAFAGGQPVKPDEDARGGCDGVKNGKWGFHTENEESPWWQVDLGRAMPLSRLVIYNRCDSGTAARASRIMVLLSADGEQFEQAYQHGGQTFLGDGGPPLSVTLADQKARYVRLQLPGKSYFHLDEVEVYAAGMAENVALNRPATQSSVSQWSVAHRDAAQSPGREYPTARAHERGLMLAENLRADGVDVAAEVQLLNSLALEAKRLPSNASDAQRRRLYLDVCWAVRRLAMKNPRLDFDSILFCKSAPGRFPHMSDQFYGWWSRPGGGIFVLEDWKSDSPRLRCLTEGFAPGSYLRPELSYDGRRVLFAYCRFYDRVPDLTDKATKQNLPEDAFYHVFEIGIDGSGLRQITRGRYDDFDARYLPSGDIVFLSTRKGQFLQCTQANTQRTIDADLPDSYVRCGGDNYRPVPVFTLHAMDTSGSRLRPLSAFENFEWTPAVTHDGRILYTRWDYIDRFNGHFFSLWSTNPDGGNSQLVYGNYTVRPQVVAEAQPVPGSTKLVMTACAHHSILGGSLVLFDRTRGTEEAAPLVRLTPEVPYPETEANGPCYYVNPWPLSEEHYLVAFSDRPLPPHTRVDDNQRNPTNATGLYLYDRFGNLNLIYRDADISSGNPIPVRPRPVPATYADLVDHHGPQEGRFLVQDVYAGLSGIPQGSIERLRVVAVPPKLQPHMNNPMLGVSKEDPGKFVLGTAPIESDGSAHFRVPSGVSVLFQAIDRDGLAVQTMRSLTYVQPGQTLGCVGCHEHRDTAPNARVVPLAALREPSRLAPGPDGSWPLKYSELVQPVLDRQCVSCHAATGSDAAAARFDLTPSRSYRTLLDYADKDIERLAFEKDRSHAGDCVARRSRLWQVLTEKPHHDVNLSADDRDRLATWLDTYAQWQGHYSAEQETQLREMKRTVSLLLEGRP